MEWQASKNTLTPPSHSAPLSRRNRACWFSEETTSFPERRSVFFVAETPHSLAASDGHGLHGNEHQPFSWSQLSDFISSSSMLRSISSLLTWIGSLPIGCSRGLCNMCADRLSLLDNRSPLRNSYVRQHWSGSGAVDPEEKRQPERHRGRGYGSATLTPRAGRKGYARL